MNENDSGRIKEKIIRFLQIRGPSLPVHISKEVGMDILFTSAFLSELTSSKRIKTSHMKVGTSPVYFIPGQETELEKFSEYIKGKEGEALNLLKSEKFLEDEKQSPAIKVALRSIKDFAKPFEKSGKVIWRYFTEKEENYLRNKEGEKKEEHEKKEKEKKISARKKYSKKAQKPKKASTKNDEKFFNKVKEHIKNKNSEILDIISFNKKELIIKIGQGKEEKLIIAYNKKRVTEKDILSAYKKAESMSLAYSILSMGEAPKKTTSIIEALKKLDSLEKID